jgi:hypothetical protein
MFNGLVKEFSKRDIDSASVIHEIWNDDDSGIGGRWEARVFRFGSSQLSFGTECIFEYCNELHPGLLFYTIYCRILSPP